MEPALYERQAESIWAGQTEQPAQDIATKGHVDAKNAQPRAHNKRHGAKRLAHDAPMGKSSGLDEFDRRLLELVRRDNQTPARILAEELGLSISAVLRRLRRLREEKVIIADIAVLDPALLGAAITIHVLVRLKQSGQLDRDHFAQAIERRAEVTGAWEVAGEEHFMLKVQVASTKDYDAFTREVLDEEAGVEAFKTMVGLRTIVSDSTADHIQDHPIW